MVLNRAQAATRQEKVTIELRTLVRRGRLVPDTKYSETELAELLGVSRTPVRHALAVLLEEGLMMRAGGRGYAVRTYRAQDVMEAIDLRGLLEGYAARRLAQRGAGRALLSDMADCLADGDALLRGWNRVEVDEVAYAAMNRRFHGLIMSAANSALLNQMAALVEHVPFAAADAIVFDRMETEQKFDLLYYAHRQHHAIHSAIREGNGARAEALLREHTQPVKDSIGLLGEGNGAVTSHFSVRDLGGSVGTFAEDAV